VTEITKDSLAPSDVTVSIFVSAVGF